MTRREAIEAICEVINSGIISMELEEKLQAVVNHICADDFEKCDGNTYGSCYCEGCQNLNED